VNTLDKKLIELMGVVKGFLCQLLILSIGYRRVNIDPELPWLYTLTLLTLPKKLDNLCKGLR
jgi:hypothetical protein